MNDDWIKDNWLLAAELAGDMSGTLLIVAAIGLFAVGAMRSTVFAVVSWVAFLTSMGTGCVAQMRLVDVVWHGTLPGIQDDTVRALMCAQVVSLWIGIASFGSHVKASATP